MYIYSIKSFLIHRNFPKKRMSKYFPGRYTRYICCITERCMKSYEINYANIECFLKCSFAQVNFERDSCINAKCNFNLRTIYHPYKLQKFFEASVAGMPFSSARPKFFIICMYDQIAMKTNFYCNYITPILIISCGVSNFLLIMRSIS